MAKPSPEKKVSLGASRQRQYLAAQIEEIQQELAEQRDLLEKIYKQDSALKRRIGVMSALSYVKLIIILVPLALGLIYLPPLFEKVMGQYQQVLGGFGQVNQAVNTIKTPVELLSAKKQAAQQQESESATSSSQQEEENILQELLNALKGE